MKRTFQPNNRRRKKTHGFRVRMRTKNGRKDARMPVGARAASVSPCERRLRLPRSARLRRRDEFQRVYSQGIRAAGRYLVVFALERDRSRPGGLVRVGVTASRRVGNAVVRARAKRRMRELFRTEGRMLSGRDVDMVINARRGCAAVPWPDLVREYRRLVTNLTERLRAG